jgi:AraC-like DNA-binding protein
LERRLQRAAEVTGESLSQFIRRAATERADALLNNGGHEDFADVLGVIHGGGGNARRTGKAFTGILADHRRSR